mgnify:CR=1 FL=1
MSRVAVIPARGGSKRIPGKNIKEFFGQPLIAWSIKAAQQSRLFDSIFVSTDSEDIAVIANEWGAETPFRRPPSLADDFTGVEAVFLHALRYLKDTGENMQYACCLQPTAPLLTGQTISECFELMKAKRAPVAMTVTSFAYPVWRALTLTKGRLEFQWPKYQMSRSQDLPELLHDAGQCYWVDVPRFLEDPRFFNENAVGYRVERWQAQDIDTEEDWRMIEMMFKAREQIV